MTKEEQIDWLCRLRTDLNNGVIFTPWNKEFTEALNGILEQEPCDCYSRQAVIDVLIRNRVHFCDMIKITSELKELPPVTPKPKWIPVSERLPKAYQECLFTVIASHWANEPVTYRVIQKAYGGEQNFIAWMPLPEPYKAESEDKE